MIPLQWEGGTQCSMYNTMAVYEKVWNKNMADKINIECLYKLLDECVLKCQRRLAKIHC